MPTLIYFSLAQQLVPSSTQPDDQYFAESSKDDQTKPNQIKSNQIKSNQSGSSLPHHGNVGIENPQTKPKLEFQCCTWVMRMQRTHKPIKQETGQALYTRQEREASVMLACIITYDHAGWRKPMIDLGRINYLQHNKHQ